MGESFFAFHSSVGDERLRRNMEKMSSYSEARSKRVTDPRNMKTASSSRKKSRTMTTMMFLFTFAEVSRVARSRSCLLLLLHSVSLATSVRNVLNFSPLERGRKKKEERRMTTIDERVDLLF